MAVALQTSAVSTDTSSTSFVCNKPASTASGDLLLASFVKVNSTTTITAPSGWTLLKTNVISASYTHSVYYKVAGGSEGASYTWSWTGAVRNLGGIIRIDGQNTNLTFGAENTNWRGNADTSGFDVSTTAGITPVAANSLIVIFTACATLAGSFSGYGIATDNPSWSEQFDTNGTGTTVACGYATRIQTTDTGAGTAAFTSFGEGCSIFLIAIDPKVTFFPRVMFI